MGWIGRSLQGMHWFVGVGAAGGGISALIDPLNPMGISAEEALEQAPFETFLIPGLFLFIVLGAGNCIGALIDRSRRDLQGYISILFGIILVLWIIIQCVMLRSVVLLHGIFLGIGMLQFLLGWVQVKQAACSPVSGY